MYSSSLADVLPVGGLRHEAAELGVQLRVDLAALLVDVVRRDAALGGAVHLARADLDLDHLAGVGQHGGVERLVEVALRRRDVVLEAVGHRREQVVHDAERAVAVVARVRDDAQPEQIVDGFEVASGAASSDRSR